MNNNSKNNISYNYKKQPSLKYRSRRNRSKCKLNHNEFCNNHCYNCYNHGFNYSNNSPCVCKKRRPGCCKINPLWWLVFLLFI